MDKEDREWVLENVENINADVKDIDELCCALEHSTIFAIDYIQTFATRLIDLDYKYKNQQQELERYKNIIDELKKYAEEEIIEGNKRPEDYVRFGIEDYVKGQIVAFKHILDKLKELKGE